MDEKLIEAIQSWFEQFGLSEGMSTGLAIIAVAFLLWRLASAGKLFIERWKNHKAAENLYPQWK